MEYKIAIVTGTRAEYGILKPLIRRLSGLRQVKLFLMVTGMHLEERFGYTCQEIEKDGFEITCRIPMHLAGDAPEQIICSMAEELEGFGKAFAMHRPDVVVLLGDRYETFVAATAAMMSRIPIAHIHGGETTEGAVDEAIRHAITKMSQLHFPATERYADRIIQMGEQPECVYNVGALGVENIRNCRLYGREQLCRQFGLYFREKYMMITYHPVTLENCTAGQQFENLLEVLNRYPDYNQIFTYANADAGGSVINRMIEVYVKEHENATAFRSMGQIGYLSALQYAELVIGNSSSGLIEAPSFGIPTINIGDRQKGRIKADSVIDCGYEQEEIEAAMQKAVSDFALECKSVHNPYEGENTSERITAILLQNLEAGIRMKKKFNDLVWKAKED